MGYQTASILKVVLDGMRCVLGPDVDFPVRVFLDLGYGLVGVGLNIRTDEFVKMLRRQGQNDPGAALPRAEVDVLLYPLEPVRRPCS